MTYNVENLFDTCHDNRFDDREFLPESERCWNSPRYWKKQGLLAKTIVAVGGISPVELVGLCEVENDSVVRDLTQKTLLNRLGYRYVITQSQDVRGLDVALLYQPNRFRLLEHSSFRVPFDSCQEHPTRDVLHASGRLPTGDTLDIFLCHLPSRRGGIKATEGYRCRATSMIRRKADSISNSRQIPLIVIMGDFNDEPLNRSLKDVLQAEGSKRWNASTKAPYALLSDTLTAMNGEIQGTYKYKRKWNRIDHIIVNAALCKGTPRIRLARNACRIQALPFLLETKSSSLQITRTYLGTFYRGGISDHLPLLLDLEWK